MATLADTIAGAGAIDASVLTKFVEVTGMPDNCEVVAINCITDNGDGTYSVCLDLAEKITVSRTVSVTVRP